MRRRWPIGDPVDRRSAAPGEGALRASAHCDATDRAAALFGTPVHLRNAFLDSPHVGPRPRLRATARGDPRRALSPGGAVALATGAGGGLEREHGLGARGVVAARATAPGRGSPRRGDARAGLAALGRPGG